MNGTVYYCWSCDAHRLAFMSPQKKACCPRCGTNLTEDMRIASANGDRDNLPILSISVARAIATTGPGWSQMSAAS